MKEASSEGETPGDKPASIEGEKEEEKKAPERMVHPPGYELGRQAAYRLITAAVVIAHIPNNAHHGLIFQIMPITASYSN